MVDYTQKIKPYFEGVAPIEPTTIANSAHSVGDIFYLDGTLVICTADISIGDDVIIAPNLNYNVMTSDDVITMVKAKINISDIVNNLTTTSDGKVLDARQGKALDESKQPKTLDTSLTIGGVTETNVEDALGGLNSAKADKQTTLSGYGITNAYTKTEVDNKISEIVTSMTWKPAVATYADIATTYPNPQEGWTVVTTDTNIAWRYSDGAWIKISANTIPVVTSEVNGLMTSDMLSKLNGIAAGAEVNVQPNWTQTNTTADDYIKNKPTIPTKTSDLTNDSGFDSSVVLTKSLAAGATSLTFTNASIGNNSRIIIYTNPYSQGVVTGATQSGTSVTIACAAQSRAYDVSIEIRN